MAERWADYDDELPEPTETAEDAKGIKTCVEYTYNKKNQKVKITKRIQVKHTQMKVPRVIEERLARIKPFGKALEPGNEDASSRDPNDVFILHPKIADQEDNQAVDLKAAMINMKMREQQRLVDQELGLITPSSGDKPSAEEPTASDKPAAYVPPSQRGGASGGGGAAGQRSDLDYTTIRVSNLSEETKEADLQDLFSTFGRVSRVFLARDMESKVSRGFAFVNFYSAAEAQRAMDRLQGYGYDHLILKLEWAKNKDPSTSTSYRSGYGKALAQDTTERVTYASNLTH